MVHRECSPQDRPQLADGVRIVFPIPTAAAGPTGKTTGPDGNLWFAEFNTSKIGRITPDGVITDSLFHAR